MDPRLLFAMQLLNSLPTLIAAGVEIKGIVDNANAKLADMAKSGRNPTAEEWAELNGNIMGLRDQLHS